MFSTASFGNGLDEVRGEIASLDAGCLTGEQAASLVTSLSALIAAAEAARALCAARVEATSLHVREGRRSAAGWLSDKGGISLGEAQSALDTARRMADQPGVASAFRSGALSSEQAASVSRAVMADPGAESVLVASAGGSTLKQLRATCRQVEANAGASAELARHQALHQARYFRYWTEDTGAVRFTGQLAPDDGARVIAVLDQATDRHFRVARRQGRREASQCYAADAFVEAMTRDRGEASGPQALVHVTVAYEALKRGYSAGDESCEIAGVGPVPVATAQAMMSDCLLKVLVTKGADVCAIASGGRTIPAKVRAALVERDKTCVVSHCDISRSLEIDHYRINYADGGPSKLDNLARLCRYHHSMKTHRGFRLRGQPGEWIWEGPPSEARDTG